MFRVFRPARDRFAERAGRRGMRGWFSGYTAPHACVQPQEGVIRKAHIISYDDGTGLLWSGPKSLFVFHMLSCTGVLNITHHVRQTLSATVLQLGWLPGGASSSSPFLVFYWQKRFLFAHSEGRTHSRTHGASPLALRAHIRRQSAPAQQPSTK